MEPLSALQVFLCALVSQPVCDRRTCAQFRGNIDHDV